MANQIQQPDTYSYAHSVWNNSDTTSTSTWYNWITSKIPHSIRCLFISDPINDSHIKKTKSLEDREAKSVTCQNILTEPENKLLKSLQEQIELNFKTTKEILEVTDMDRDRDRAKECLERNEKDRYLVAKLFNLIANNFPELIHRASAIFFKQRNEMGKNTYICIDLNNLLIESLVENFQKKESSRSCNLWNLLKKPEPAQYRFTKAPELKKCVLDFLHSNGFGRGYCNLLGDIWIINHSKKITLQKDITLKSTGVKEIILESILKDSTSYAQQTSSNTLLGKRSFELVFCNDCQYAACQGFSKKEDDIVKLSKKITETGEHECLYKRIALIGETNHLVTAYVSMASGVNFYDPDIGEFRFPNKEEFHTWFCTEYWKKSGSVFERTDSHRVSNYKLS